MNKITKLGVSALCGSLASISAVSAGEMSVSGTANVTYTQLGYGETGNPLGMKSNLSFSGSGELDGGQTFKLAIDNTDANAYSAADISLTTNSLGTFNLNQAGGGNGIGGYDDNMPRAWEEVWDTGVGAGADFAKGVGSSMNVGWVSPSFGGITLKAAYAPKYGAGAQGDKAVSGASSIYGSGYDVVLDIKPEILSGLEIFAGYSSVELDNGTFGVAGEQAAKDDYESGTAGITYTLGPIKAGFQRTGEHFANQRPGSTEYYANMSWGVSFNVNDDLSVSYGKFQSRKGFVTQRDNETVIMEGDSLQASYTMGGLTLAIAESEIDNASYTTTAAKQHDGTTVSLTLAF
jgi:hypothetical protein